MLSKISSRMYRALAQRIVPGMVHSQRVYLEQLKGLLTPGCDWLDLGCGHQILPGWVQADEPKLIEPCRSVTGIDLDLPSLRQNQIFAGRVALANLEQIPFAAESFDVVTANMVVEHLGHPLQVLSEVRRVLRPGGRFLFNTPNRQAPALRVAAHTPEALKKPIVWFLERRAGEDVFPTFYRMNTADDIAALTKQAGFRIQHTEQINSRAVTAVLGPLALPELLLLRLTERERFKNLRMNFVVTLEKL
jgi:2-polyprenyl-3-methyl-5-hydroxy-6-metoxy-1,4-benzoquinol methylase